MILSSKLKARASATRTRQKHKANKRLFCMLVGANPEVIDRNALLILSLHLLSWIPAMIPSSLVYFVCQATGRALRRQDLGPVWANLEIFLDLSLG
jgi:hypothetical protein